MSCKKLPTFAVAYPEFRTVTGRSLGCWLRSWWLIGNEFVEARLHPTPVGGVLAPVIHGYILADFPTFYDKAFMSWKGNMGFSSIIDDGHSLTAVYPVSPVWVDNFAKTRFWWSRDEDNQPNGCMCCINRGDCWQNP